MQPSVDAISIDLRQRGIYIALVKTPIQRHNPNESLDFNADRLASAFVIGWGREGRMHSIYLSCRKNYRMTDKCIIN